MQLRLSVVTYRNEPPAEPSGYTFDGTSGVVGRESGEGIVWVLQDSTNVVSRRHARIEYRDGRYFLTDISANGVLVTASGDRLELNVPHSIEDGERFTIGDYVIAASLVGDEGVAERQGVEAGDADRAAHHDDGGSAVGSAMRREGWEGAGRKPSWWTEHPGDSEDSANKPSWRDGRRLDERPPSVKDIHMPPPDAGEAARDDGGSRFVPGPFAPKPKQGQETTGHAATSPTPEDEGSRYIPGPFGRPVSKDQGASPASPSSGWVASGREDHPLSEEQGRKASGRDRSAEQRVPAAASEDVQQLLQSVLAILGVPDLPVSVDTAPAVLRTVAVMLREALEGTIQVLRERDEFKYHHRIAGSVLYDNPLKFAVRVEDAVERILRHCTEEQARPAQIVRQTFTDIRAHQAALMGAAEGAARGGGSLAAFDPDRLEQDWFREISSVEHLVAIKRKAKLWDLYTENYRMLAKQATDAFEKEMQEKFARAYADQLASLRAAGIGGPMTPEPPGRKR